jgi:hypothetical protein
VEVERAYRIIGVLEETAKAIQAQIVPKLVEAKAKWRRRTLWLDGIVFGAVIAALAFVSVKAGYWQGLRFEPPWLDTLLSDRILLGAAAVVVLLAAGYIHLGLRKLAARSVIGRLQKDESLGARKEWLIRAFQKNVQPWHFLFARQPTGWSRFNRKRLARVLSDANSYVQTLNNRFADPSGTAPVDPKTAAPMRPGEARSADARILKSVRSKTAPEAEVKEADDEHAVMDEARPGTT